MFLFFIFGETGVPTKGLVGKFLLGALLWLGLTASLRAADDIPLTATTTLHFATKAEAAALLARRDEYTRATSLFDRQARMKTAKLVSAADFRAFSAQHARDWPADEKTRVAAAVKALKPRLAELNLQLPERILLIHTSGQEEGGAAYCRQNGVILPAKRLPREPLRLQRLLAHELFHILSRQQPELRAKLYRIIGFQVCSEIELPEKLRDRKITNPDAPRIDCQMTIEHAGKKVLAAPVLYATVERYDPQQGGSFFRYMRFRLMVVEPKEAGFQPLLVDGNPVMIDPAKSPSFLRQIGQNTGYIIHPDEVLADNFSFLVMGKIGLKTPRIVVEMRELLGR
jgi:hypothetical protein